MGNITRKAKNMYKIVEENYITKVGGTLTKTAEEINIFTTEGDISLYSNTSIDIKAEDGVILGEYQEPKRNEDKGELLECYYTDMKNNKIDSLNFDKVKLIIKSIDMIGSIVDIDVSDNPNSFLLYKKEIPENIIKNFIIKSDIDEIILETVQP